MNDKPTDILDIILTVFQKNCKFFWWGFARAVGKTSPRWRNRLSFVCVHLRLTALATYFVCSRSAIGPNQPSVLVLLNISSFHFSCTPYKYIYIPKYTYLKRLTESCKWTRAKERVVPARITLSMRGLPPDFHGLLLTNIEVHTALYNLKPGIVLPSLTLGQAHSPDCNWFAATLPKSNPLSYITLSGLRQKLGAACVFCLYCKSLLLLISCDLCANLQAAFKYNSSLYLFFRVEESVLRKPIGTRIQIVFLIEFFHLASHVSRILRAIMANVDVYPGFENFDDLSVYERYEAAISDNDTLNMVVEFDSARASSALNIDNPAMSLVLGKKVNLNPRKKIRQIKRIYTADMRSDTWTGYWFTALRASKNAVDVSHPAASPSWY